MSTKKLIIAVVAVIFFTAPAVNAQPSQNSDSDSVIRNLNLNSNKWTKKPKKPLQNLIEEPYWTKAKAFAKDYGFNDLFFYVPTEDGDTILAGRDTVDSVSFLRIKSGKVMVFPENTSVDFGGYQDGKPLILYKDEGEEKWKILNI